MSFSRGRIVAVMLVLTAFVVFLFIDKGGVVIPFEDWGASKGKDFAYGTNWVAQQDVAVYANRDPSSKVLFAIPAHAIVGVVDGVIITTKAGLGEITSPETVDGEKLAVGTRVAVLGSYWNGAYKIWANSGRLRYLVTDRAAKGSWERMHYAWNLKLLEPPSSVWWLSIKDKQSRSGWAMAEAFRPNDQLLISMLFAQIPLGEKLKQVDGMVAKGADRNGPSSGGFMSPVDMAKDISEPYLAMALYDRGWYPKEECLAYGFYSLPTEERIKAAELLLDHGMSRNCQPLPRYIYSWGARPDEEGALTKKAKFLLSRGIDINAPDPSGKKLLEQIREDHAIGGRCETNFNKSTNGALERCKANAKQAEKELEQILAKGAEAHPS